MDDILTGAPDVLAARKLRDELIQLLKAGGFPLRKWASNHSALIQGLDQEERLRPAWRDFQTEGPIQVSRGIQPLINSDSEFPEGVSLRAPPSTKHWV